MPRSSVTIKHAIRMLRKEYGRPKRLTTTDPFELILWENVAYLASPESRPDAFERLKRTVGTSPAAIVAADFHELEQCTSAGKLSVIAAEKLRRCAEIAIEEFAGDLKPIVRGNIDIAKRA